MEAGMGEDIRCGKCGATMHMPYAGETYQCACGGGCVTTLHLNAKGNTFFATRQDDEIVVTPQMIEAGVALLIEWEESENYRRSDFVESLYRRLAALDCSRSPQR
jgi:hypothetical protein